MKFHCLLPVRDEGDIIGQCLAHQLTWADAIYVFDTGSVDDTWEIVQAVATRDKRVIPLRRDPVYFSDTAARGWLFEQARRNMRTGDWFLRADADEFHHLPPPEFVATRLRKHETVVWHQYYNFCLLTSEVDAWNQSRETLTDRARPIADRRRWYLTDSYSEPRLCRYRDTMRWPIGTSFPYNAGFVAHERLPIRHYPHRDPPQLQRRCRLRTTMLADETNRANWTRPELHHWSQREWQSFVTPDANPGLQYWAPGEELPLVHHTNHLASPLKRLAQKVTHALFLPFLDWTRDGWRDEDYPRPLPNHLQSRLAQSL